MASLSPLFIASAATAAGGGGEHGGGLLSVETGIVIVTWITFLALLVILAKFAWRPLLGVIEARERKVADDVERAERARAEAERMLAEYEARLARAAEEAEGILAEGRAKAEAAGERLRSEAHAEAEAMLARARRTLEEERRKAVAELRAVVAKSSVDLARKILEAEIDESRHRDLIDKFTKEVVH